MELFKNRCPNCWGRHLWCNQTFRLRVRAWFKEQWRIFVLTWADRFSMWALKLRGQKIYSTDCQVSGNEASALHDRIWSSLVIAGLDKDLEYCKAVEHDLNRLAQIAKTTWCHSDEERNRPPLEPSWLKEFETKE